MHINTQKFSSIAFVSVCLYSLSVAASLSFHKKIDNGFFIYFLVFASFLSISYYILKIQTGILAKSYMLLALLIFSMLFSVFFQSVFFENLQEIKSMGRNAHAYLLSATIIAIIWMLAGFSTGLSLSFRKNNFISISLIIFLLFLVIPLLDKSFVINYRVIGEKLSHLTVADGFYLLIITAVAFARGKTYWLVVALSLILLFMLAGRTSLATFILVISIYHFFTVGRERKILYLTAFPIGLIIALSLVQVLSETIADKGLASTMLFSQGLMNDSSFIARNELLIQGFYSLENVFLVGDISNLIRTNGTLGAYIHNILSWIQFYGVPSFIILLCVIFHSIKKMLKDFQLIKFDNKKNNFETSFRILLVLSGLIGVVIGKFGNYSILMFSLGLYLSLTSNAQFKSRGF